MNIKITEHPYLFLYTKFIKEYNIVLKTQIPFAYENIKQPKTVGNLAMK